jgi:hypothetical protein
MNSLVFFFREVGNTQYVALWRSGGLVISFLGMWTSQKRVVGMWRISLEHRSTVRSRTYLCRLGTGRRSATVCQYHEKSAVAVAVAVVVAFFGRSTSSTPYSVAIDVAVTPEGYIDTLPVILSGL